KYLGYSWQDEWKMKKLNSLCWDDQPGSPLSFFLLMTSQILRGACNIMALKLPDLNTSDLRHARRLPSKPHPPILW
ncbi:Hypothetical predicted protein, partial [Olea europaea subsp. europaea]